MKTFCFFLSITLKTLTILSGGTPGAMQSRAHLLTLLDLFFSSPFRQCIYCEPTHMGNGINPSRVITRSGCRQRKENLNQIRIQRPCARGHP